VHSGSNTIRESTIISADALAEQSSDRARSSGITNRDLLSGSQVNISTELAATPVPESPGFQVMSASITPEKKKLAAEQEKKAAEWATTMDTGQDLIEQKGSIPDEVKTTVFVTQKIARERPSTAPLPSRSGSQQVRKRHRKVGYVSQMLRLLPRGPNAARLFNRFFQSPVTFSAGGFAAVSKTQNIAGKICEKGRADIRILIEAQLQKEINAGHANFDKAEYEAGFNIFKEFALSNREESKQQHIRMKMNKMRKLTREGQFIQQNLGMNDAEADAEDSEDASPSIMDDFAEDQYDSEDPAGEQNGAVTEEDSEDLDY
jgi:hypothetical protein